MENLPVPFVTADSEPFWEACNREQLLVQVCGLCGRPQWYPRGRCRYCYSYEMKWKEASGEGNVYSFSIVRRATDPAFAGMVPYVVALVELDEGIRMITHITDCELERLEIGARVVVHFREQGGFKLPVFRPK